MKEGSSDIGDARRHFPQRDYPQLYKLGIDGKVSCDVAEHTIDQEFRLALWNFQKRHALPITGTLDQPTKTALEGFSDECPNR